MPLKQHLRHMTLFGIMAVILVVGYYTWTVYDARKHTIRKVIPLEETARYPLSPASMTPRQLDILLKIQDPQFFNHHGVDLSTPGAGLTTITQSLVKFIYFENFKAGMAKIKQTLIARFALDPLMSKEMQLRRFINTAYLGQGIKGFSSAANYYFQKPFRELTEEEYMAIVAMLIAPTTFNIERYPERNKARVARIKQVVTGEYRPKGLCDLYYGKLDAETQKQLPPASYFASYYE